MSTYIFKSVGYHATNLAADVRTIQMLLNQTPASRGGPTAPLAADGFCSSALLGAIRNFQLVRCGYADGRIDPGDFTHNALLGRSLLFAPRLAVPSSTYVAMPAPPKIGKPPARIVTPARRSWLLRKLDAIDRACQGNATQDVGWLIWGEGSGDGSTATKLSAHGCIVSEVETKEMEEIFELLELAAPEGTHYREVLKEFKDAFHLKDPYKVAKWVMESRKQIIETFELEEKPNFADHLPLPIIQQPVSTPVNEEKKKVVEMGQWVAYDQSGNMYVKIAYSNGNKRFVFASIYGHKDIADPGPMEWRRTR